jgi:hypothetical protein
MNTNRNRTQHTEFRFEDGETFTMERRNTVGGWANMMRRVEERTGGTVRPADTEGRNWTTNGRTFTVQNVCKL